MSEADMTNLETQKPQFTAALLLEKPVKLSFSQLQAEVKRLAPQSLLGDWDGPITDPAVDPGIEMLSIDGEKLSVLVVDAPAPAGVLEAGPFLNPLWPNAETEAAHKAHIVIVGLQDPTDRDAALAKARAVTLIAAAIARLVPAVGATWADAANLVRASAFVEMTKDIGQPDGNAVPFWVRIMLAKGEAKLFGKPTMSAATLGLRIFGSRELEYAPAALDPGFLIQHAYSIAEYLLTSGRRLADGETLGVEGEAEFTISHADAGDFVPVPVARLALRSSR
jgi:hypothetical protein